ncbi:hypothetical protein Vretifemale_20449, partial [Volvox reticuliferus]
NSLRKKRDEDDDDLGATGGRKKRTKPIKPVKKGAGSKKKEVTRAGRRPGGSNMDVSEEEWEDGDSGSTPSGTSSESGSSGGGIRQAVPVPQTARLKALTQKQARAGRGGVRCRSWAIRCRAIRCGAATKEACCRDGGDA